MAKFPKPPLNRNAQLTRILGILRDLDRLDGIDLYELAERYGTSVRTIRRDFDALDEVGLPIVEESTGGPHGRKTWRVAFKESLSKLSSLLDASHYLALRVAMGQGGPVRTASSLFAALEDLSGKVETALGKAQRGKLSAIDACFYSYEKFAYRRSPPDVFWPLVTAITERRVCGVKYRAPKPKGEAKSNWFRILPLRLFTHDGAVYVHALVVRFGGLVALNLQRVEELQVHEEKGTPPKDYKPQDWENAAFGIFTGGKLTEYSLRFTPECAPYIRERVWHPSQTLKDTKDGGVELTFTCGASYEVDAWAASWRDGVEVLAPESLRTELKEFGQRLAEKYA